MQRTSLDMMEYSSEQPHQPAHLRGKRQKVELERFREWWEGDGSEDR